MSSYMPLELITKILSKLDIQTLLRCRSVSKQWCSLIDGNDFMKTHMNQSIKTNTNNTLFIIYEDGHLDLVDFDTLCRGNNPIFLQGHPITRLRKPIDLFIGSCNGLLSLAEEDGGILICNPSLQKYKHIPPFFPYTFNTILMFSSNGEMVFGRGYGFGYDAASNDYEVVRIVQFLKPDAQWKESEMTIYSAMKHLSWVIKMPYLVLAKNAMGVYLWGALHWIVSRFDNLTGTQVIVGFDLGVDEFREVPPPDYGDNVTSLDVGVLGGCLCAFAKFEGVGVDVWVMKEYGVKESWSKVFLISSSILCYNSVRPLGYSNEGGMVLLELDRERLLWYEIEKKRVVDFVTEGWKLDDFDAILCLNSLFVPMHEHPPTKKRKMVKNRDTIKIFETIKIHIGLVNLIQLEIEIASQSKVLKLERQVNYSLGYELLLLGSVPL
ncbi:unnamed protein product [Dovyalis caffra]|uniref:F-box domain-containing protein n=1 Tax=Dovyalis caffra TaxID=77055 RepID=A0AAV1RUG0_9ROSI|nr:unnamed protein product [Dovyalis caffra]